MINIRLTDILDTDSQYTKNLPLAIIIGYFFLLILTTFFEFNFYFLNKSESEFNISKYFINNLEKINSVNSDQSEYLNNLWGNTIINDIISYNYNLLETKIFNFTQLEVLGFSLYTFYAILLIILAIILLLSMLSAVIVSNHK